MDSNEKKQVEIVIRGQQANATMREIQSAARVLNAELRKLPVNSSEFAAKTKELQQVNKRLKSITDDVKGVGGVFGKIGQEIKAFGVIAAGALGFQWLTGKMRDLIGQNAKLSDSFADIRKTTGMTEAEVNKLNKAFGQMNTRTSSSNLRDIAIAAGQLGIAKKDILSFTAATDKLVVALGDEFTGGAEQVTKEMGALRNVFTDIKTDKVDEDMLHIGNAINELGAAGMATGPVVSDFANRIGGVGISLGLTSGQVLGLSATLQELNVSTERGGTAVTKILLKMTQETEKFASVAGMSTKDFAELVNKDLYGAFVKVAEGSKKSGQSATQFSKILDDLGVDGAGASEVFSKLGTNTKLLQEKVDLANKSLKTTDGIINEFNIKNETFGAKIDKIGKALSNAFVNSAIMNGMEKMVGWIADLVDKTDAADKAAETWKKQKGYVDNLELSMKPLLSRYDELSVKTTLSTAEQTELDSIVQQIAGNIPMAVTEFDKYGKAMGISSEKAREFIETQKAILLEKNREAIVETTNKIKSLDAAISGTQKALNKFDQSGNHIKVVADAQGLFEKEVRLTNKEIADLQEKLNELQTRKSGSVGILNELKGIKPEFKNIGDGIVDLSKLTMDELRKLGTAEAQAEIQRRTAFQEDLNKKTIEANRKMLEEIAEQKVDLLRDDELRERAKAELENVRRITDINLSVAYDEVKHKALETQKEVHERKLYEIEYKYRALREGQEAEYYRRKKQEDLRREQETEDAFAEAAAKDDAETTVRLNRQFEEAFNKQEFARTEKEKNKQLAIAAAQQLERELSDTIFTAQQARIQREREIDLQASETRHNTEAQRLQAQLTAGKITQAQFDREKLRSDKRFAAQQLAIKKQAFEDEKRMRIAQVGINLAIELSNIAIAAAQNPLNGGTGGAAGVVQYSIQAGLAIARAAIQTGAIGAQKFAKGGFNNNPQGFTNSATLYTNSASGKPFVAGEAGREWIAPNWMINHPKTAPIFEHLETIRQNRGFASGGSTSTKTEAPKFANQNNAGNGIDVTALTSAVNTLNAILGNGIAAYLDYDGHTRQIDKINAAKDAARVG